MSIAIYPGSFDPITKGHLSVLKAGLIAFDMIIIAILQNSEKRYLFDLDERKQMVHEAMIENDIESKKVQVDSFHGLLVDYCKKKKARVILRGLRAVSDFEYEFQMANMNRHLYSDAETVFIMADNTHFYVSSRLIKEVASLKGQISGLVPECVATQLEKRLKKI